MRRRSRARFSVRLRCLLLGHDWVVGRLASKEAREALTLYGKRLPKHVNNRACIRCGRMDLAAERMEADYHRRDALRNSLKSKA